jgi:hypothetical protein
MVLFPEIQRKAQDEIDEVVGKHRLPTFEDRRNLPYIAALQKEIFRWHVIGPMGNILPETILFLFPSANH